MRKDIKIEVKLCFQDIDISVKHTNAILNFLNSNFYRKLFAPFPAPIFLFYGYLDSFCIVETSNSDIVLQIYIFFK